jgi:hypothetical protein
MAKNRIYNHKSRILGTQPGLFKAIIPGMIISFKYRKKKVFDDNPILLVLYKDYYKNLVHGLNLNYLTDFEIKLMIGKIMTGASVYSESKNILKIEDQTGDYDDALPYRNLLKKPYTRLKLPVFKEKREGNPISKSEAKKQMDILYEKVVKKVMKQKQLNAYRTYHINLVSNTKVLEFDFSK